MTRTNAIPAHKTAYLFVLIVHGVIGVYTLLTCQMTVNNILLIIACILSVWSGSIYVRSQEDEGLSSDLFRLFQLFQAIVVGCLFMVFGKGI